MTSRVLGAIVPWMAGVAGASAQEPAPRNDLEQQRAEAEASWGRDERLVAAEQTSPLVIPAADLSDDGVRPDSAFFSNLGGYWVGTSDYGCLIAPAYLPNGATVTDVFATAWDNDVSSNLTISLRRGESLTGGGSTLATLARTGASPGVQLPSDSTIDDPLMVYPAYSYYLTTCLTSPSLWLYSVRIEFEAPIFADGFESGSTSAWPTVVP